MNSRKLAERLLAGIRERGLPDPGDIRKFTELKREEGKEVIGHLIGMVEDVEARRRLFELHRRRIHRYDSRLELLMVWIALDPSVQEGFDPEDVV